MQSSPEVVEEEKAILLPIAEIDDDKKWNIRYNLGDTSEGGPGEQNFSDFMNALESQGLLYSVIVRPHPLPTHFKYALVAGFRRTTAFKRLYSEGRTVKGIPPGQIRAIVRPYTPEEARKANIGENIRKNLPNPDLAQAIHVLNSEFKLSNVQIAKDVGLSFAHVAMLHRIRDGLVQLRYIGPIEPEINCFEYWRRNPTCLPLQELNSFVRIRLNPRLKEMKFLEITQKKEKPETPPARIERTYSADDLKKVERFATQLGRLERKGLVQVVKHDWIELLQAGIFFEWKGTLTEDQIEQVIRRAVVAYEKALEG